MHSSIPPSAGLRAGSRDAEETGKRGEFGSCKGGDFHNRGTEDTEKTLGKGKLYVIPGHLIVPLPYSSSPLRGEDRGGGERKRRPGIQGDLSYKNQSLITNHCFFRITNHESRHILQFSHLPTNITKYQGGWGISLTVFSSSR